MKNCLIVSNGRIDDYSKIREILIERYDFNDKTFIISADGATSSCKKIRICPDVIIGDMDSASQKDIDYFSSKNNDLKFLKFPRKKDESDTQLAIDYAVKEGYDRIIIIGALGGRVDHCLANIFNLFSGSYDKAEIKIVSEDCEITVLKKPAVISGQPGKEVSIFSMTPYTFFNNTSGLEYNLRDEKLLFSPIRGLSNKFTKSRAELDFSDGILLIIKQI